jgi:hypothetical protein
MAPSPATRWFPWAAQADEEDQLADASSPSPQDAGKAAEKELMWALKESMALQSAPLPGFKESCSTLLWIPTTWPSLKHRPQRTARNTVYFNINGVAHALDNETPRLSMRTDRSDEGNLQFVEHVRIFLN